MTSTPAAAFSEGDPVAYSVQFLESIGASHSEIAHLRGKVTELKKIGDRHFAQVSWDDATSMTVAIDNLAHTGPNLRFCKC